MQPVKKKAGRSLRHGRVWLLGALVLLLGVSVTVWRLADTKQSVEMPVRVDHSGVMYSYDTKDVASLRLTLRSGESWQLTQAADGSIAVDGDGSYQAVQRKVDSLLNAASAVTWQDVLTEDAASYEAHYADFGLDTPRIIAEIAYRDGTAVTLRIGNDDAEESGWSYMLIDGDTRLLAVDSGTADALSVKKEELHPVEQPVLHKARMDSITFTGADGQIQAQWTLQGGIGGDAGDRWLLTEPAVYPADGARMDSLLENLENLHLGTYVGEVTAENLTAYGFDAPRFRIDIHMAEGAMGTTGAEGVYDVIDWPESSFTLTVGGAKSEHVDYVLVEGSIYLTSHYSMQTFMGMNPKDTLTRYVIPVALGNLAEMTIQRQAGMDTYLLTRTEQVAENNDLVYDANGQVVYDIACTRNGQTIAYTAFEAAYNNLLMVTVSGSLPEGWQAADEPHTVYTLTQRDGTVHQVALVRYDALHDAVYLDGEARFYLIAGGMDFQLEE